MKIERAEVITIKIPMKFGFETSYGRQDARETVLVRLFSGGMSGWGEAAVSENPDYCYETPPVAMMVLEKYLLPRVVGHEFNDPYELQKELDVVTGYPFCRTGVESAFIDLYCKSKGIPEYEFLGGRKILVEPGISLGIEEDQGVLFDRIRWALEEGYKRIKLKIKPGRDIGIISAVREAFEYFPLMVDANSAYTIKDIDLFKALDEYGMIMIEQPLAPDDLAFHAELQKRIRTHICLDESIRGLADVMAADKLGSCRIINVKFGRVGGLLAGKKMASKCIRGGIAVWCGGMLESGIGRAHNLALATLDEFSLPGDISASNRYWEEDIIDPAVILVDGFIEVPQKPGIGFEVKEDLVKKYQVQNIVVK